MDHAPLSESVSTLQADLDTLLSKLPDLKHGALIEQALKTLVRTAYEDTDRLDWKILLGSLQDMERAFQLFHPYRHVRKIAVFGSARTDPQDPDYEIARDFARLITQQGFMVMTGAGGGIMEAANEGAGREHSFGLNVRLPFEQQANPFIEGDPKLLQFKYFFTRKLFFLRETDAVAVFPGGFGTQDEAFECLTLTQTGKFGPAPMIFVERPGGDYWKSWNTYIHEQLLSRGLVSEDDHSIYTVTDNLEVACQAITHFYRVYHSSRFVGTEFVMRLNTELSDADLETLNQSFSDIVVTGPIRKCSTFPEELGDETENLPRIAFQFNQRDTGRLYQMIALINDLGSSTPATTHPEQK
jgi:hypothetical protein